MWGGAAGVVDYAKLVAQGEVSPREDAFDFAEAFYVDQCVTIGNEGGFDFLQALTPEAVALTQQLATSRVVGEIGTHVLSLFAPVALFKAARGAKLIEAASPRCQRVGGYGSRIAGPANALRNWQLSGRLWPTARTPPRHSLEQRNLRRPSNRSEPTFIKALVHPTRLPIAGGRALNPRLHNLLYRLHEAELNGGDPRELVRRAMSETVERGKPLQFVDAEIDVPQVLQTFRQAKERALR